MVDNTVGRLFGQLREAMVGGVQQAGSGAQSVRGVLSSGSQVSTNNTANLTISQQILVGGQQASSEAAGGIVELSATQAATTTQRAASEAQKEEVNAEITALHGHRERMEADRVRVQEERARQEVANTAFASEHSAAFALSLIHI